MIVIETHYINNKQFTKTYSDEYRYVVREGVSYEQAWDPSEFNRTYTQGELIPIENIEIATNERQFI